MRLACAMIVVVVSAVVASAKCVPIDAAPGRLGEATCITGQVLKVTRDDHGNQYLDFCDQPGNCPFRAVVFPRDLRDVGDVRSLEGKTIEIYGKIAANDGQPQMVLKDVKQLRGEAAKIPPIPKGYDVEGTKHVSAGRFKAPKQYKTSKKRARRGGIEDSIVNEEAP